MTANLHPQTAAALGQLLHKLAGNPKTRARTLGMIKELEPGYRLPGDIAVDNLRAEIKADLQKERDTENQNRAKNRRAKQRKDLVDELGEDVVKAIEDGPLKKYPHIDYTDAAKLYRSEDGPAMVGHRPETQKAGRIWEFPDLPGLMANPEKAAMDAAYSVIDELRAGKR
jgi:hypothetical protein